MTGLPGLTATPWKIRSPSERITLSVKSRVPAEEPAEIRTKIVLLDCRAEGFTDEVGIVRYDREAGAVCPHLGEEDLGHDRVALYDLPRPGTDAEGHELASGGDNPDLDRKDIDICYPVGGKRPDIKSPDDMAAGEHELVLFHILPCRADMLPGCGRFPDLELPARIPRCPRS